MGSYTQRNPDGSTTEIATGADKDYYHGKDYRGKESLEAAHEEFPREVRYRTGVMVEAWTHRPKGWKHLLFTHLEELSKQARKLCDQTGKGE